MIIIDLPSGKIGVLFSHRIFKKPVFDKSICNRFMNGQTLCEIYKFSPLNGPDLHLWASGKGICKHPDSFNKRLGRKRALQSALNKKIGTGSKFSKGDRQLIWAAYWATQIPAAQQVLPEGVQVAEPSKLDVSGNMMHPDQ